MSRMPDTPIFKTRAMVRTERRLGRPIEEWLVERYREKTQPEIAEELGLSDATISRWMRDLGIESRLTGQRPPGVPA